MPHYQHLPVALRTTSLGGSDAGFSPTGLFSNLSLQSAGNSHSYLLKKVAGFLRSMLCTLQTWNLFGGSVVDTSRWFISIFPRWGFFSLQSAGISLLLAEEGCRFPSIRVFARCKHGTCSDEVQWSLWMVGRSRQLDEGAGRQKWKCHDPLNCVASAASCVALPIV